LAASLTDAPSAKFLCSDRSFLVFAPSSSPPDITSAQSIVASFIANHVVCTSATRSGANSARKLVAIAKRLRGMVKVFTDMVEQCVDVRVGRAIDRTAHRRT
jgi:tRNA A37 threonylcarbamoyladenosine synthetase subunit TsaC/SUA5/YrdC